MLDILPFLTWLAAITSAILLTVELASGELRLFSRIALVVWFLIAAYGQFFAGSFVVRAVGLSLQTILAIVLLVRRKLG